MGKKGRKKAVFLIKNGRFTKSVDALIDLPRGLNKLVKWLKPWGRMDRALMPLGLSTERLFENPNWILTLQGLFPNSRPWAGYLNRRLDNPTFVNSLVSLSLARKGVSLDAGSGMGHFLSFLEKVAGAGNTIGLDNSFWNLYFSSFVNKNSSHIFCDVEAGLPFKEGVLENMFFNDCLHCFTNKKKVADEVARALKKSGFVSLSHVHNFKSEENFFGEPVTFSDFRKLFKKFKIYAIPEAVLHKEIVLENDFFTLGELEIFESSLPLSPSYIAYLFKAPRKSQKINLLRKLGQQLKSSSLNYSEDKWLKRG